MRPFARVLARLLAFAALLGIAAQPVAAQSILRDAETEALLKELIDPLVEAAGMPRGAVDVVLIHDPSLNAFVAGGQRVYVHSGLINAADTANEVQGVLAHELGHITGGHVISGPQAAGNAMKVQVLSILAGIAAALAGAGEAGMAAMALGQQAAMNNYLGFSRTQEASADAASVQFLKCAGISGRGAVSFFRKLQNLEFRYGYSQSDDAGFARTHPLTGDRVSRLEADLKNDPAWGAPEADLFAEFDAPSASPRDEVRPPAEVGSNCAAAPVPTADVERRFQLAKAKLYGYLATPAQTLRSYPESMTGAPARYARAYAYHKDVRLDDALAEADALIADEPGNPYFLELKGQILLEAGQPLAALEPLRQATTITGNNPLIASLFAHALMATEDGSHLAEAEQVLKGAVGRDRENPSAWYQLGVVYGARGDIPRAQLASAEQQIMSGRPREALYSAESAERALPMGSPDWLRAQDVAMQARAELERTRDRN
ncbi:MAG TPA: M48 family metalloprotease [Croceibacterium sp.]